MGPHRERTPRALAALGSGDSVPLELWIGGEKLDVRIDATGICFAQGEREALLRWPDALGLALLRTPRPGPEAA
jgi:hypothetical protein